MDFTFSPEQEALRDAVRSFLDREGGRELVRRAVEDGGRVPDELPIDDRPRRAESPSEPEEEIR